MCYIVALGRRVTGMQSVEELRKDIESAFPPIAYTGAVTPSDMEARREELDDSCELAEKLKGKAWTSIPAEFIDLHPGICLC
jgi:hypothetical protein